jgi:hypothetical protein
MKKFSEQLKKRADSIHLNVEEKAHLRERMLAFMEYHPLPDSQGVDLRSVTKAKKTPSSFWNVWMAGRFAGGFAMLLLVSVPALAENALPGDTLYPIKVRFNEEVKGALNSSPYQKIEWETERLERRLAEAQLLADAGLLTPEAEAEVANAIRKHSRTARSNIEAMRISDSDEAAMAEITLSSSLAVSAEVLLRKDQNTGSSSASVLSGAVSEARANVALSGENVSYPRLLSRVEAETTKAYEYLNTLEASISGNERTDVSRRLTDIKKQVDSAVVMQKENEEGAAKLLAEALSSTRKLISFMTNLDVRKTVTVNDLVPIVLTPEEKKELLNNKLSEVLNIAVLVEAESQSMATNSNDYVAVVDTLGQIDSLVTKAESSLEAGDMSGAEAQVATVLELARALKDMMVGLGFNLKQ